MTTDQKLINPEHGAALLPPFATPGAIAAHESAMQEVHKALNVDHCKFARTWADSTREQRRAILIMLPEKYLARERVPGYLGYAWADLPIKVQAGYKAVLQRFARWVAERGLAS